MMTTPKNESKSAPNVDKVSEAKNASFAPVRGENRIPVNGRRLKLDASALVEQKYPGHQAKWVNDEPGEVERYLQGGWELVEGDISSFRHRLSHESSSLGNYVHQRVGTSSSGQAMMAYLMVIPDELFEEDVASYKQSVDSGFNAVLEGNMKPQDGTSAEAKHTPFYDPLSDKNSAEYIEGRSSKNGLHQSDGLGKHG